MQIRITKQSLLFMKFRNLIITFSLLLLAVSIQAQQGPISNKKNIAPDNCLVQAKVVRIVPSRRKVSKQSCKKSPCIAYIKIIKVEEYGSSFPEKFSKKQKVQVKFVYSLKPLKNDRIDLPGLKKRDVIKAKISARPKMNSNITEYLIFNYQRL